MAVATAVVNKALYLTRNPEQEINNRVTILLVDWLANVHRRLGHLR